MVTAAVPAVERQTVSIEEAATFLGVSRWLAYELVKRGELPTVRLGRRVLVPRAALDRMLEGTQGAGANGHAV